jgi:peptide/nickel transport system substrate-binding protein
VARGMASGHDGVSGAGRWRDFDGRLLVALSAARRYEWGHYCDPRMDKLFEAIRNTFDPAEQAKVLRKTHEKYVDEALFLMVTHDVNPCAMTAKVKGFVQAKNWFQNLSSISMAR